MLRTVRIVVTTTTKIRAVAEGGTASVTTSPELAKPIVARVSAALRKLSPLFAQLRSIGANKEEDL